MVESKEELQKILNEFWLLDVNEYSIIKDLINDDIEKYREKMLRVETSGILLNESVLESPDVKDEIRHYYQDKRMVEFYIVMKEKIQYIISKGLYKKYVYNK